VYKMLSFPPATEKTKLFVIAQRIAHFPLSRLALSLDSSLCSFSLPCRFLLNSTSFIDLLLLHHLVS